jgi:hypothetical protein
MKVKIWSIAVLVTFGLLSAIAHSQVTAGSDTAPPPGTFTLRPSTYSGGGLGGPYSHPTYAYDGSFTTASTGSVVQLIGIKGATVSYETWFGFPSAPPGASGIQLNVNSAAVSSRGGDAILYYSLDRGATFKTVYSVNNSSRGQQTDVISLSDTQDLTQVRVKGWIVADTDGTFQSTASQSIYEIWISGND